MIQIDIDIPKTCDDCPFHIYHSGNNYVCVATPLFYPMNLANYKDGRKDFCPLKEVSQELTTKIEESNFSQEQYLADMQSAYDCGKSVIDKIRAEILRISSYEGFELGGVKDGYRIAMVNVLNIIDKYKGESENT